MSRNVQEITEFISENMGGQAVTMRNLVKLKMPTGGGQAWTIPTAEGDEMLREFECVVPAWATRRVFWDSKYGEGEAGAPPACWSDDGVTGKGEYGADGPYGHNGDCATCPMNEWPGKDATKRRKPCREMRVLMVLLCADGKAITGEQVLPYALILTPGSLKTFGDFMIKLSSLGRSYRGATIKIGLQKVENRTGLDYSQATFAAGQQLTQDETAWLRAYGEAMLPSLNKVTIDQGDMGGE